ncbi:alpha/beta fold hydrolase [Natronorubrum daqingense]|uniref:Alpha/beta hydrolase n=1 Tax=Natronorubrum daqingense TaxID=588898 RepID=A0A1N7D4E2_9EURY|nr:alpha/beta hydrolase [Natronorubrum daqingense]APX97203.1 alpha/beta hydrolase [Natronorubrum daqingense]SIR70651.1 Pimeloyl-ACP methyl ester carboxylesterase [Natronorubrum daqingense]
MTGSNGIDEGAHGTERVNDVSIHYVTAGSGPPLVLLHGWPQTWYEWREVIPAFASEYTVIAPDLRGMGDSTTPLSGYDKDTVATDIRELVHALGHGDERIALVGHDWGMPTAYAYAAQYRDEVAALCVLEAGLPGIREDEKRHFWHTRFHGVRDLPERLVAGRERLYLEWFYKKGAYDPAAIDSDARDEYVRCYSQPGGLRGGFEYYRAYDDDVENNAAHAETPLEMPVLALGGEASFRSLPIEDMNAVATDVEGEVLENAGHWIPEERPEYFVERVQSFLETATT